MKINSAGNIFLGPWGRFSRQPVSLLEPAGPFCREWFTGWFNVTEQTGGNHERNERHENDGREFTGKGLHPQILQIPQIIS